jgi:hypothetical protein
VTTPAAMAAAAVGRRCPAARRSRTLAGPSGRSVCAVRGACGAGTTAWPRFSSWLHKANYHYLLHGKYEARGARCDAARGGGGRLALFAFRSHHHIIPVIPK